MYYLHTIRSIENTVCLMKTFLSANCLIYYSLCYITVYTDKKSGHIFFEGLQMKKKVLLKYKSHVSCDMSCLIKPLFPHPPLQPNKEKKEVCMNFLIHKYMLLECFITYFHTNTKKIF